MNGARTARWWRTPGPWLALLTLVIYLAAWNSGTDGLYQLAVLLLATLLAGYLLPRYNLRDLAVSREIPEETVEGERIDVVLRLRARGPFARYMLQVCDRLPFLDQPEYPVLIARLAGAREFRYPIECERRGIHRLGPLSVRSEFPLALLSVEREISNSASTITVLPRPFPLSRLALSGRGGFPTEGHQVGAVSRGQDSFAGIREYRRGDSMRHIHWRASARRDEWIVREYEQVENAELVLVLNTCRTDNVGAGRESSFEYSVRIAASLARFATDNGHKVGLLRQQQAQQVWLAPDSGETHYRHLLEHLAATEADSGLSYPQQVESAALLAGRQSRLVLFHTLNDRAPEQRGLVSGRAEQPPLQLCFDAASFRGDARIAGVGEGVSAAPGVYWIRAGDNLTEVFER